MEKDEGLKSLLETKMSDTVARFLDACAEHGEVQIHVRDNCDCLDAVVWLPEHNRLIITERVHLGEYAEEDPEKDGDGTRFAPSPGVS